MKKAKVILIFSGIALALCAAILAIAALVVSKTGNIPVSTSPLITTLMCCVSVFCGAYLASRVIRENGIVTGLLVAAVFSLVLVSAALIIDPASMGLAAIWKILAIVLSGATAGILAVNRQEKVKF